MSLKVELKSSDIAALVNGNKDLKAAVLAEYLKQNAPELDITDLQGGAEKDTITLSGQALNVPLAGQGQVDVALTGKADLVVKSADERIATAAYADGKLTAHGAAAGDTDVVLTKGDATATVKVAVR